MQIMQRLSSLRLGTYLHQVCLLRNADEPKRKYNDAEYFIYVPLPPSDVGKQSSRPVISGTYSQGYWAWTGV